jgi:hypothetical protein
VPTPNAPVVLGRAVYEALWFPGGAVIRPAGVFRDLLAD